MAQRKKAGVSPKTIKWIWGVVFAPFALLAVMLLLTALGLFGRMPSFEELENPRSNLATEIYSEDGKVIGSFFVQNRSYVQYEDLFPADSAFHIRLDGHDMPPIVAALIATEDARFRTHSGIDIPSLARVAVKTVLLQNTSQGGGSTITQQLAKNLFPRDTVRNRGRIVRSSKLVVSKLKEWITALKLEYNYTKEEIAAMYLNTVEFGSNAYGIKSAAHTFFNKEPDELNVQEAAVLVGVVNAPTRYSPVRNPENALARRNLVLSRMEDAGALTRKERDSISALPIVLNYKPVSHNEGTATYFREMLRLVMNAERPKRNQFYTEWDYEQAVKEYENNPIYGWCHKNTKADGTPYNIYRDGLKIYTTVNSTMQKYAEQAVQKQMQSVIQPRMDAQYRNTKTLFIDATREERERIMRHAIRYSDRYREMEDAEKALDGVRIKVPDEETDEVCELCGRKMVIKSGRFGRFLACPGFPECKNTKPLVERMPGRCPRCGSGMLKRKSKKGYVYYACERGAECGFMTWDVPTAQDCPSCGQTMFKKSGRGQMKPFCINEKCPDFLPEDKRGYKRRMPKATTDTVENAEEITPAAEETEKKPAKTAKTTKTGKTAKAAKTAKTAKTTKKAAEKKPAARKKTKTESEA